MKKIVFIISLCFVYTLAHSQVKPGVYYLEYKYKNSLATDNLEEVGHYDSSTLTIDSLREDGSDTFSAYIEGNACIIVVITGNWSFKDGILTVSNQLLKERFECFEKFKRPKREKGFNGISNYNIVESTESYFIGECIEDPNVTIKWKREK